jgi:NAD(P)-dependent dehydrogenase (short-subunit alcohol dehydrogenase family)
VLEGKVAIVTGATSGIGARTAELFAEEGATVVIAGRRAEAGEALASRLGPSASFVRTDVSSAPDVKGLVEGTAERHGHLDVLVNNAGYGIPQTSIADLDIDAYDRLMAVLVRGVMLGMKYAAPYMIRQRSGSIVNIASVAAHRAGYSSQTYAAAKAAVMQLSRVVAAELGEHGVRVNSISPGAIITGIFGKAANIDPSLADQQADVLAGRFEGMQPIPRAGRPDDIARGALYLASDASSFVNGADLVIDGGLLTGNRFSSGAAARQQMYDVLTQDAEARG